MALPVVQFFVRDQAGNTVPFADITVTLTDGPLATVYSDRDGLIPIPQPFTPDPDGFVRFYCLPDVYDIEADFGSSTTTFTEVEVSSAASHVDPTYQTQFLDDRFARQITQIGAGDGLQGGGDLSGDLTFDVDATVVRTTGAQTIAGDKTLSDALTITADAAVMLDLDRGGPADNVVIRYKNSDNSVNVFAGGYGPDSWGVGTESSLSNQANRYFSVTPDGPFSEVSQGPAVNALTRRDYVDSEIAAVQADTDSKVPLTRSINSGDGLTGGGDLSADRTLAVDATVARTTTNINANDGLSGGGDLSADVNLSVDATVVRTTRAVNTGSGLDGGGTLAGDLSLSVDATVVRTTREVIAGDGLDGGGNLGSDITLDVDATVVRTPATVVRTNREVNSGDGLAGGGDLTADRTLAVDATVVRTTRSVLAGDGMTGGGTLGADVTVSVDATVVRTTGNQTVAGLKTFATTPKAPDPVDSDDLATKAYVDEQNGNGGAVPDSRTLTAGDGLTGGGDLSADRTFGVDSSVVRTTGAQTIAGQKTFSTPVLITGGNPAELVVKGKRATKWTIQRNDRGGFLMRVKGNGYQVLRAVESDRLVIILRHMTFHREFKLIHREKVKGRWDETRTSIFTDRARASNAFIRDIREAEIDGIRFTRDYPANSVDYRAAGEKAVTAHAVEKRRYSPRVTA